MVGFYFEKLCDTKLILRTRFAVYVGRRLMKKVQLGTHLSPASTLLAYPDIYTLSHLKLSCCLSVPGFFQVVVVVLKLPADRAKGVRELL